MAQCPPTAAQSSESEPGVRTHTQTANGNKVRRRKKEVSGRKLVSSYQIVKFSTGQV